MPIKMPKKFLDEFKTFALRGNVMDLAVGVIIGGAFSGIVTSLTDNILSPIIGLFTGGNFDGLQISFLGITLKYGAFITSVMNFFIMAFVVFLLVKLMNTLMNLGHKDETPAETTKVCPFCKSTIDIGATRCPNCTSQLETDNKQPA